MILYATYNYYFTLRKGKGLKFPLRKLQSSSLNFNDI